MESLRDRLERMAQQFADQTRNLEGVAEVAVVGSAATDTIEPGNLDLAVLLTDRESIPAVARAARRLTSISNKWAVWILEAEPRRFLGWVGVRKCEPLIVDPNFEFDERRFLNVNPVVLWSRANNLMTRWREEAQEKAALVGWPLPQPLADRRLKCLDCEEHWVWSAHEQRVFRERHWKAPIRCHQCRPYRCGICGRKTAISKREAEETEVFACEFCAMELEGMTDLVEDEAYAVRGAPIRTGPFDFDDLDEGL